ncbi:Protein CBG28059 [Caenorhabditis briggsae]|nr:Protein CBG28059 [Caenorhabditis briggsae]CAR99079.1 Protein CBG28059 [Caenorhabditis briggsae]
MESSESSKQNVDFDSVRFATMCNPPKDRDVGEINLENVPSYVVEESHLEIIRAADPQDIVEFDTKNDIQLVEYSAYDDRKDTVSTNQEDNNDSPNSSQGSVPALDFDTEHGYVTAPEPESDCRQV